MGAIFKPNATVASAQSKLNAEVTKQTAAAEQEKITAAQPAILAAEQAKAKLDFEKDKALLAGGNQDLMNKRVYDLARVRNRAASYQAPTLGGDMTGARKTLLGQ